MPEDSLWNGEKQKDYKMIQRGVSIAGTPFLCRNARIKAGMLEINIFIFL